MLFYHICFYYLSPYCADSHLFCGHVWLSLNLSKNTCTKANLSHLVFVAHIFLPCDLSWIYFSCTQSCLQLIPFLLCTHIGMFGPSSYNPMVYPQTCGVKKLFKDGSIIYQIYPGKNEYYAKDKLVNDIYVKYNIPKEMDF